jgi:hypothetical protein
MPMRRPTPQVPIQVFFVILVVADRLWLGAGPRGTVQVACAATYVNLHCHTW